MAQTSFGSGHALEQTVWAKSLWVESLKETVASDYIGKEDTNIIQIKDDLKKDGGAKVRIGLRLQLNGPGISGDSTLEGNEEALQTAHDDVYIDQLRHAVLVVGDMSQQRVAFDKRKEAKSGLADWWSARFDTMIFNQLGGNTGQTDVRYTGMQAAIAPHGISAATAQTSHAIISDYGGGAGNLNANEAALASGDVFDLAYVDRARVRARTVSPAIRMAKVGGARRYVCFVHPLSVYDMRRGVSAGQWLDIQKAAMSGGKIGDNPIVTGALGEHNNTLLVEAQRVPYGDNTGPSTEFHTDMGAAGDSTDTVRNIFCGAQAAALAIGRASDGLPRMKWTEKLKDYENQYGIAAASILGVKKMTFNSKDLSTITISTFSAQ